MNAEALLALAADSGHDLIDEAALRQIYVADAHTLLLPDRRGNQRISRSRARR